MKSVTKDIQINISEEQTIVELSKDLQPFSSEVYIKKIVGGKVIEVNIKSFLGLITLQIHNGDTVNVRAVGEDCEEALAAVVNYLT
ncbi:HPr family phosphocarrier protein [Halalkalibacter oceani]|uniref:HPr family phosphocarrier protein n=1 Tax=Halalkalibacter oceani TaxID=1653776 RepID=A0A9X2DN24_9BACI|nr:HPr family phosphocarrier protein [Halalkalibacter oceani]